MLQYLRDHFQGRLSLAVSFWINFIALAALLHLAGTRLREAVSGDPGATFLIALLWFLGINVAIYAWQVRGVWRASERALLDYANSLWVRGAQGIVLLSLIGVFGQALEVVRLGHLRHGPPPAPDARTEPAYVLELSGDGSVVQLTGAIHFGVTRDLGVLLEQHPMVRTLDLDSDGGLVSEGRGVARLIARYGLATHVRANCSSACTLAYMSGVQRHLGPRARLGFHSYRLDSPYLPIFIDPAEELRKDLVLFRSRGIEPAFLERVFATPHTDMWFPTHDELLSAGVVHEIRLRW